MDNCQLTLGPACENIAKVDDSVLRIIVGDAGALPLPEADLVPQVSAPAPGLRSQSLLTPAAHPR